MTDQKRLKAELQSSMMLFERYFSKRPDKEKADNSPECKSVFSANDARLSSVMTDFKRKLQNKKIPSFGLSFPIVTLGSNSGLLKRCCTCPDDGIHYNVKNAIRKKLEVFMNSYFKKFELWQEIGEPELEIQTSVIVNDYRKRGKIQTKRTF